MKTLLASALLLLATPAWAQDSEGNVTWRPTSRQGSTFIYDKQVEMGADDTHKMVCLYRTDVDPRQLLVCALTSSQPGELVNFQLNLQFVPHDDQQIQGFAYDHTEIAEALESEPSNTAFVPMSPPGKVKVLP